MREDPELLRRYDEARLAAGGADSYWQAKDELIKNVLAESPGAARDLGGV